MGKEGKSTNECCYGQLRLSPVGDPLLNWLCPTGAVGYPPTPPVHHFIEGTAPWSFKSLALQPHKCSEHTPTPRESPQLESLQGLQEEPINIMVIVSDERMQRAQQHLLNLENKVL